jgi:hypothetical protein
MKLSGSHSRLLKMIIAQSPALTLTQIDPTWPREVGLILSALEAGNWNEERRGSRRAFYYVKAALRLFTDGDTAPERELFTRDVTPRSLGFITSHRLPLGYGGTVKLASPRGRTITAACTLIRCREASAGWYEGAMYFNREQNDFADLGWHPSMKIPRRLRQAVEQFRSIDQSLS